MLNVNKHLGGDTIIEVLLCITVLAFVFSASYGLASHTMAESITASEHTTAINLAQSQLEALKIRHQRSSVSVWNSNFAKPDLNFCLDTTATDPSASNWLPISQMTSKDPTNLTVSSSSDINYKVGCVVPQDVNNAKYFINISTQTNVSGGTPTYLVTVRWIRIGSSDQNLSRIYFRLPITTITAPSSGGVGGGSAYTGCPSGICPTAPDGYYVDLQNYLELFNESQTTLSAAQVANITSCKWDWGDGTTDSGPASDLSKACLPDPNNITNRIVHNYPVFPPRTFKQYQVSLIEYVNGSPVDVFSQWWTIPVFWMCSPAQFGLPGCYVWSTTPPPTLTPCNPNDDPLKPNCQRYNPTFTALDP